MSSRKRKNPSKGTKRPLRKVLKECVERLEKKDRKKIFLHPVSAEEVPVYYQIITNPMDFSTMRKNIANGKYKTWGDFESDFELIINNCTTFNPEGTIWHRAALRLKKDSRKIFEELKQETEVEQSAPAPEPKVTKSVSKSTSKPVSKSVSKSVTKSVASKAISSSSGMPAEERKKRRYIKSGLYKRKQRDFGSEASGGLLMNDLGMGNVATLFDLLTIWTREQIVQEMGCRPFTQRTGNCLIETQVGPLYYPQFRPFRDSAFGVQYEKRIENFIQGAPKCMLERAKRKVNIAHGLVHESQKKNWRVPAELLKDEIKGETGKSENNAAPKEGLENVKVFGVTLEDLKSLDKVEGLSSVDGVLKKMIDAGNNITNHIIHQRKLAEERAKAKVAAEMAAKAAAQAAEKKKKAAQAAALAAAQQQQQQIKQNQQLQQQLQQQQYNMYMQQQQQQKMQQFQLHGFNNHAKHQAQQQLAAAAAAAQAAAQAAHQRRQQQMLRMQQQQVQQQLQMRQRQIAAHMGGAMPVSTVVAQGNMPTANQQQIQRAVQIQRQLQQQQQAQAQRNRQNQR